MTAKAPGRSFAHYDGRVSYGGGTYGDTALGSLLAQRQGFKWIDCNGHLTSDLMWVNAHGAPYNPPWLKRGDKFESYTARVLHARHPSLRSARRAFLDNARLGLSTEWEVKDLHPLTSDADLETAFSRLRGSARLAYGDNWQQRVEVKVLTNLRGGLKYAKKICRHAHAAGFTTIILPRGINKLRKIDEPYVTFNRGGRV